MKQLIIFILLINFSYANAYWVCQIKKASTGLLKYRGTSQELAMSKVAGECLRLLKEEYEAKKGIRCPLNRKVFHLDYCMKNLHCWETL